MKKTYRKSMIFVLVAAILCAVSLPVNAIDISREMEINRYAYMDINTVDGETKELILDARNKIIFDEAWAADGIEAYVTDLDGNIVEKLPEFSEIFPADWTVPVFTNNLPTTDLNPVAELAQLQTVPFSYIDDIRVEKPSPNYDTRPFRTIKGVEFPGTQVERYLEYVSTAGMNGSYDITFNLGYSNADTGASLAYKNRLTRGQGLSIYPPRGVSVGIRASTYSNPYTWQFYTNGYHKFKYTQ